VTTTTFSNCMAEGPSKRGTWHMRQARVTDILCFSLAKI
jgi:hypothetical protein